MNYTHYATKVTNSCNNKPNSKFEYVTGESQKLKRLTGCGKSYVADIKTKQTNLLNPDIKKILVRVGERFRWEQEQG